jgi:hypothetical protein
MMYQKEIRHIGRCNQHRAEAALELSDILILESGTYVPSGNHNVSFSAVCDLKYDVTLFEDMNWTINN